MSTADVVDGSRERVAYLALHAIARGIDHVHHAGILSARSGVALDRGLHPVITTIGQRGPMRTKELAAALALKSSTVSRHAARLEELGLVTRFDDPADARASHIHLTEKGMATFEALRSTWEAVLADVLEEVDGSRPGDLATGLLAVGLKLGEVRATRLDRPDE